jgi:hypothetical protein
VLPKSALSCAVENFVGTNSEGRNGPFDMESHHHEKGPARADPFPSPLIAHRLTPVSLERFSHWLRYHRSQPLGSLLINRNQGDNFIRRG